MLDKTHCNSKIREKHTMKTDISYTSDGFFVTLYPNTNHGRNVWNAINESFPGCKIPVTAWAGTKAQIKDAGYSVRKARPVKMTDAEILAGLEG